VLKRLLWIVDANALAAEIVPAVLRAGVGWLQLRDPDVPLDVWRGQLEGWRVTGRGLDVVVNGGPDWAREAACGAHLKAAQGRLSSTQRMTWPLLGRSVHGVNETVRALNDRPDYLVAGPVFATRSKPGHPGIDVPGLAEIVERAGHTPVLAVGGITPRRVLEVAGAGAAGVVVLSGITGAADPEQAARAYLAALGEAFLPADAG